MKVGILTHYYQSINYGGNLQAYALAKVVRSLGHDAELICYVMNSWKTVNASDILGYQLTRLKLSRLVRAGRRRIYKLFLKYMGFETQHQMAVHFRKKAFFNFNQNIIPHSQIIYNDLNIEKSIEIYDAFITGSDQVWNPDCYLKPFYLDFVPSNKKKIAYAASIAKNKLSESEASIFRVSLESFSAVSVREKTSVDLLKDISPVKIHYLIDPTLLVSKSEWEDLCNKNNKEKNYIFCYFLGTNSRIYREIKKFAKAKNLKIINIPYGGEQYVWNSEYFGDIKIIDADPKDFLSLIQNASYIFTDSYHAVIFSFIFEKQFFVFNRDREHDINIRIYDLLKLLELSGRFCDTIDKEKYKYFQKLNQIDYERKFIKLMKKRNDSMEFLKQSLKGI